MRPCKDMWLAWYISTYANDPTVQRVFTAIGSSKHAAENSMQELLGNHGFNDYQINKILTSRMKIREMGQKLHGFTEIIYVEGNNV
jgi:hypothetical protein